MREVILLRREEYYEEEIDKMVNALKKEDDE